MAKDPLLGKVRRLALKLPGAHEVEAWGSPTFRVKNKMFATFAGTDNNHHPGRPAVWVNCEPENQELLVRSRPERFFKPPYLGPKGWVAVYLDKRVSWKEVEAQLRDGWKRTAPKKLLGELKHR